MSKQKKESNKLSTITARIPKEMAEQLKQLCISMSKQEGRIISVSHLIRESLKPFVKIPVQEDIFSKKKRRLKKDSLLTV